MLVDFQEPTMLEHLHQRMRLSMHVLMFCFTLARKVRRRLLSSEKTRAKTFHEYPFCPKIPQAKISKFFESFLFSFFFLGPVCCRYWKIIFWLQMVFTLLSVCSWLLFHRPRRWIMLLTKYKESLQRSSNSVDKYVWPSFFSVSHKHPNQDAKHLSRLAGGQSGRLFCGGSTKLTVGQSAYELVTNL